MKWIETRSKCSKAGDASNCELEDTNRAGFGEQDRFDSDEEFIPSFCKSKNKNKNLNAQKKATYICDKKVYNTNKTTKISYKTRELTNPFIEEDDEMRVAENKTIAAAGNNHLFWSKTNKRRI